MRQLHLHIISQDFNSASLKNKKHWNSFTTSFFRDSVDVIEEIEQNGSTTTSSDEKVLAMELRCHRCRSAHPNIPKLKSHIAICKSSFPSRLLQRNRLLLSSTMHMDRTQMLELDDQLSLHAHFACRACLRIVLIDFFFNADQWKLALLFRDHYLCWRAY